MPTRASGFAGDGPRISVPALIKAPTMIQRIVYKMTDQQFFVDQILRDAGDAPSGTFVFYEGTPLFVNDVTPIVNQGAEIPVTSANMGNPTPGWTVKRALGIEITEEMRDRNDYDAVNTQLRQLKNTFDRDWNAAFLASVLAKAPTLQSASHLTAGGWAAGDNVTATKQFVRTDLATAQQVIQLADADSANGTGTQKFGFFPTDLVIHPNAATSLMTSREFQALFVGNVADQAALLADTPVQRLPQKIMGLNIWVSWQMPAAQALVLQRKVLGGIINEKQLTTTPLYRINQKQVWRSDTDRRSAVFIDQPKAAVLITNIDGS